MRISDWSSDVCSSDLAVLSRDTVVTERDVETVLRENGEGGGAAEPSVLIARAVDDWVREQLAGAANDGVLHEQLEAIVEAALFRRVLREVRGKIGSASCRERVCQYV